MSQDSITKTIQWQSLAQMLDPERDKSHSLVGFDPEFKDIADYILRITHRIWEQKNIGKCLDYYSEYCPVHTLGGYCDSVHTVVQNTLKTIAAFPDRSLIGEDVIYNVEENDVYYSSHRITSIMTNKGASEFGPATGKTGRVTTIADCMCKDNKIYYEWLMRDNSFLIAQLGIKLMDAAKIQADAPVCDEFTQWINGEYARTRAGKNMSWGALDKGDENYGRWAQKWCDSLFNHKLFHQLPDFYHPTAEVQWPGGRQATGIPAINGQLIAWLSQCADVRMVVDHVCVTHYDEQQVHIALRWGAAGTFTSNHSELRQFNGQAHYILGATHLELREGKIAREWTVFDEVAAVANLMRQLPQKEQQ